MSKIYKLANIYENICFNLFKIAGLKEVKEKYPNIFKEIDELNKQVKPKYLDWGAKQINNGFVLQDIVEALKTFDRLSQNLEIIDRNINNYDSLETLKTKLETLQLKQRRSVDTKDLDAKVLYEDERYTMVRPDTKMASIKLGSGTKWCITEQAATHYEYYQTNNVVFYILIDKTMQSSNTNYKVAFSVERDLECKVIKITGWDAVDKDRVPEKYPGYSLIKDIIKKDAEIMPPNMIVYFNKEMLSDEEANYFLLVQPKEHLKAIRIPNRYKKLINPAANIEAETKEQKYQYLRNLNISITKKNHMIDKETDPNTLLYLSTKNDLPHEVIISIIINNNTPTNTLDFLYKKYKDIEEFMYNNNCPAHILFDFLVKSDPKYIHDIFRNKHVNTKMIDFLIRLRNKKMLNYSACCTNVINNNFIPLEEKIKIVNNSNASDFIDKLRYMTMPSDLLYAILIEIKKDIGRLHSSNIYEMLNCNNIDEKCIKVILELCPDLDVIKIASTIQSYKFLNYLSESKDENLLYKILTNERLDEDLYLKIKDKISDVKKIKAVTPYVSDYLDLFSLFLKYENDSVIAGIAKEIRDEIEYKKVYEILINHKSVEVRLALSKNDFIPELIAKQLMEDKDQQVREAAAETYKFLSEKEPDDYISGHQNVNTTQIPPDQAAFWQSTQWQPPQEQEQEREQKREREVETLEDVKLKQRKQSFPTSELPDEYISLHGTEEQMMELLDKNPPQEILENMAYNTKIPYNVQFELALLNNYKVNKILYDNPTVDEDIKRDLHAYFHEEYEK